jgi:hypothetical protein
LAPYLVNFATGFSFDESKASTEAREASSYTSVVLDKDTRKQRIFYQNFPISQNFNVNI